MSTLRNTLYVSLTLQICLAAAIMAAAEEGPLSLVTIPVALGSLLLIDLLGWLKPPRLLLNVAALVALGFAFVEFRSQNPEEGQLNRLLAGGHLIVYLTWTFLLQVKDLRRMWWMFALSVLHIALGAVLTNQPWFGAALFVYTASAVWTMSLLSLTRAALLADAHLLSSEPVSLLPDEVIQAPLVRTSFAMNGVRTDEQGRWISPRFLGGGVITFGLIVIIGMTFFVLTPRIWIGSLNVFGSSPLRNHGKATGFTENVKLGDIGQIMESDALVMEVTVINGLTEQLIPPAGMAAAVGAEPLFRGAVLDSYVDGSWEKGSYRWNPCFVSLSPVQLKITLQPLDSSVLFYTGAAVGASSLMDSEQLYYQPSTLALERADDSDRSRPYTYLVYTTPPYHGNEEDLPKKPRAFRLMNGGISRQMRPLLETPTDRLSKLAQQVLDRSTQDGAPDSASTARVLESYLRDSNEFGYSLDLSVEDATIDPVEDFVFNRKQGHCEYFASALALMLRGVGIPSRLISGFKGAEYNSQTQQLEVRALHAHAWVEAFVDGGWITLDPTPGLRDMEVASKAKETSPDLVDKGRSFWFQGMNYSKSEQDQLVYGPLRSVAEMVKSNLTGLMQGELPLLTELKTLSTSPSRWLSGEGGVVFFSLLLMITLLVWLSNALLKRWKGWSRDRDLVQRRAITVEFYARLLRILQRFGLTDLQTQTPREFAHRAEERFESRFRAAGVTGSTLELVETFYAVRFGDQPLSADQLGQVEQQLSQLERSLTQPVTKGERG